MYAIGCTNRYDPIKFSKGWYLIIKSISDSRKDHGTYTCKNAPRSYLRVQCDDMDPLL